MRPLFAARGQAVAPTAACAHHLSHTSYRHAFGAVIITAKLDELEALARHKTTLSSRAGARRLDPEDAVCARLAGLPEVRLAIVFGSRALGDAEGRSDLDLALSCSGISHRRWVEIAEAVEQAETLVPIDLVWLEEAPVALREEIRRTGRIVYERAQT